MSELMISYAWRRRSEAEQVEAHLRARGVDAWIDQPGPGDPDSAIGAIPVGHRHEPVVFAAIEESLAVLVLDCAEWRASEDCQREYEHAMTWGKRVAVVPLGEAGGQDGPTATWDVEGLEGVVDHLHDDAEGVAAHSRLVRAAAGEGPRTGRSQARLLGDVEALSEAGPSAGITITPLLDRYAKEILGSARRWRIIRATVALAVIASVATVAVFALVARSWGLADRRKAEASAASQESLDLAERARSAGTTRERERLAELALQRSDTPDAVAAAHTIRAEAQGVRRFQSGLGPAYTIAITDDDRTIMIGTGDARAGEKLVALDTATGRTGHPIPVDASSVPWMTALAPDGSWAVFASPDMSKLSRVSFRPARSAAVVAIVDRFSAFTIARDGALWWATSDGTIYRMPDVWRPSNRERVGGAGGHVTALTVAADGTGLVALIDSGMAIRFRLVDRPGQRGLIEADRVPLLVGLAPGYGADNGVGRSHPPDVLLQCGSTLLAYRGSTWGAETVTGNLRSDFTDEDLFQGSSWAPQPGCVRDAAVSITLRPPAETAPRDAPLPAGLVTDSEGYGLYQVAGDRSGSHVVIARQSGVIDLYDLAAHPLDRPWDVAASVIPINGGALVATVQGELWWDGTDGRRNKIGVVEAMPDLLPIAVRQGGLFASHQGVALADRNGIQAEGTLGEPPTAAARDGNGAVVSTTSGLVWIPDLHKLGGLAHRIVPVRGLKPKEAIRALAAGSLDEVYVTTNLGRLLAVGRLDGQVRAVATAGPALAPIAVAVTKSPSGQAVLTYSSDGVIRSFDGSLRPIRSAPLLSGPGRYLTVSPDGHDVLAASLSGRILLLDPMSLQTIQELADGVRGSGVEFTPDGRTVVTAQLARTTDPTTGSVTWLNHVREYPIAN